MDLDAYVLAHHAEWQRLEALTAQAAARRAPRATSSSSATSRSPPTSRWSAPPRPTPRWSPTCRSLLARARNRAGRHAGSAPGAASRRSSPTASRPRSTGCGGGGSGCMAANVVVDRGDDVVAARPPRTSSRACCRPREVDQLVNHDFEGYYSEYAASHFAAQVWINNAWVTALCLALGRPRPAGGLPALPEHREPRDHRLDHDPARPRRAVLGADPPARAARADRGLRRRRRRAAAVLVVGRAGRPDPRASRSPARAGPPAPSRSAWSRVLLVSGVIEAFVTPSGLPTWARVGIGILAEAAFFAYVFVLGRARRTAAATPATSTPRCSRTGSPPRPERSASAARWARRLPGRRAADPSSEQAARLEAR